MTKIQVNSPITIQIEDGAPITLTPTEAEELYLQLKTALHKTDPPFVYPYVWPGIIYDRYPWTTITWGNTSDNLLTVKTNL